MQCRTIRPVILILGKAALESWIPGSSPRPGILESWIPEAALESWNPGFREAALSSYAYSSHISALG